MGSNAFVTGLVMPADRAFSFRDLVGFEEKDRGEGTMTSRCSLNEVCKSDRVAIFAPYARPGDLVSYTNPVDTPSSTFTQDRLIEHFLVIFVGGVAREIIPTYERICSGPRGLRSLKQLNHRSNVHGFELVAQMARNIFCAVEQWVFER
jgi:hypothetical protein